LGAEIWVPWQQPAGVTNWQAVIMAAACLLEKKKKKSEKEREREREREREARFEWQSYLVILNSRNLSSSSSNHRR
jgi:hypothetical protein